MKVPFYLGIDPGVGGAVGVLDQWGTFVGVFDMPTTASTTGRRQLDAASLAEILKRYPGYATLERVHARPGEGAVGAFSFGQTFGGIVGVLEALGFPYELASPAGWKRGMAIPPGADKEASISAARRLLPTAAEHLMRKRDDGRAEALLLAEFGRRRRG
ncbi:hypothetical protein ACKVEX_05490 [Rhodocyclaceae bacterium SMB388]